jgi:flavin reductase (DIM6/NTAB) family NADH-FMN oxidoreductase RutF
MKRSLGPQTIVFPTPVFLVGTYDEKDTPNIMTAAWAGICCSKPPCVYVSLREATYTFGNIVKRKAFTISIPPENFVKEADFCGLASGKEGDKFKAAKLTPVRSDLVDAPYVAEFPFIVECALVKTVPLGLHTQFIGEVKDIKVEESAVTEGTADIAMIKPLIFNPAAREYYALGKFAGKAFSIGAR